MERKTPRLYPSAPLENNDLEQRLEKKLNVVNCFKNSIRNIREMEIYFKDKNHESKKKYKNILLTTILKSIDTFVINATIYTSITLSLTRIGLIVIPVSTGTACGLTFSNKVMYERVMQKNNNCEKKIK